MGKVIAFNDAGKAARSARVRPQPTTKKGYPNHFVQQAIISEFVAGKDVRSLGRQLRREYGPRFGESYAQRVLREAVHFGGKEAA